MRPQHSSCFTTAWKCSVLQLSFYTQINTKKKRKENKIKYKTFSHDQRKLNIKIESKKNTQFLKQIIKTKK